MAQIHAAVKDKLDHNDKNSQLGKGAFLEGFPKLSIGEKADWDSSNLQIKKLRQHPVSMAELVRQLAHHGHFNLVF
ncbi:MAG: hypothetical protein VB997_02280 [Opitutales bacterium]